MSGNHGADDEVLNVITFNPNDGDVFFFFFFLGLWNKSLASTTFELESGQR